MTLAWMAGMSGHSNCTALSTVTIPTTHSLTMRQNYFGKIGRKNGKGKAFRLLLLQPIVRTPSFVRRKRNKCSECSWFGRGGGIEIASLLSKSNKGNGVAPPPHSNWSLLEPWHAGWVVLPQIQFVREKNWLCVVILSNPAVRSPFEIQS